MKFLRRKSNQHEDDLEIGQEMARPPLPEDDFAEDEFDYWDEAEPTQEVAAHEPTPRPVSSPQPAAVPDAAPIFPSAQAPRCGGLKPVDSNTVTELRQDTPPPRRPRPSPAEAEQARRALLEECRPDLVDPRTIAAAVTSAATTNAVRDSGLTELRSAFVAPEPSPEPSAPSTAQEPAPEMPQAAQVVPAPVASRPPQPSDLVFGDGEPVQANAPQMETAQAATPDIGQIEVPPPSTGRAGAGRAKTRLLGFSRGEDESADPFGDGATDAAAAAERGRFPVGWLVVSDGPGRGAYFTLFSGVSQIGRGEDQAVRLDFGDNSISRSNHALLAFDDEQGKFFLGSGGKVNIVRLNDKPLLSTEELSNEDEIRIGETRLRFIALCGEGFAWAADGRDDDER